MPTFPTINFITWLLLGIVAGLVVRIFDGDKYNNELKGTMISAIAGAVIGGIVTNNILGMASSDLSLPALLTAMGLALVLSVSYNLLFNRDPRQLIRHFPQDTRIVPKPSYAFYSEIKKSPSKSKSNIFDSDFFDDIKYPVSKSDLLSFAERREHNVRLVNVFERLPDHIYESLSDIKSSLK